MTPASILPDRLVLEAVDPATECVVIKAKLQAVESAGVLDLLSADVRAIVSSGAECDLEPGEVAQITARFNLAFEPGGLPVRIRSAYRHDDLPYLVHDGRELALMLEGRKPLAVFSLWNPLRPDRELFPEKVFDPYVDSGEFVKRERSHPGRESSGKRIPAARTVLYALPLHAWRINAYLLLRDTADKVGWSEGFERMQGSLLGYEDWQNDIFIEQIYRPAMASRRTS